MNCAFLDLRFVTVLIRMTWPNFRHLTDAPELARAIDDHVDEQDRVIHNRRQEGRRTAPTVFYDRPPLNSIACAGLLTSADQILDMSDPSTAREVLQPLIADVRSNPAWLRFLNAAKDHCSPNLRTMIETMTVTARGDGRTNANKIRPPLADPPNSYGRWLKLHSRCPPPGRRYQFDHRHIPQVLPEDWFDRYFHDLTGMHPRMLRRLASIRLVQMAHGGGFPAAGRLLGYSPGKSYEAHRSSHGIAGPVIDRLHALADELDAARNLVNYERRRQALAAWTIPPDEWDSLTMGLRHGTFRRADWGHRKRHIASALVWMFATDGDHLLAPLVQRDRLAYGNPCQLAIDTQHAIYQQRTHPTGSYRAITDLARSYAQNLAGSIDRSESDLRAAPEAGESRPSRVPGVATEDLAKASYVEKRDI
jgi:hypothetical protein